MAFRKRVATTSNSEELARAAGIDTGRPLTLSDVDKRRTQLWTVSLFVLVALGAIAVLYRFAYDYIPVELQLGNLSSSIAAILIAGLFLAFLLYIVDKEARLRRLTNRLVEERVLSAALSKRLSEISALSVVGKAINTTLDITDVLSLILSSSIELLGGTEGSIMLVEDDKEHLRVVSYQGPRYENVMGRQATVGQGIAGTVAETRQAMLIQGDRVTGELKGQGGIHSAMCVPLIRNEDLLGVLNLTETEGRRSFTEHDLNALGLFAEHAAIAIWNAALFERERETIQRLEELDQLKSDFVASVSHELKTPLTAIIGAAKTVSRRGANMAPEQHASFLEMIERQGNRLLRLVEDVLTTAQIESGQPRIRRELIHLRELANIVIEDLQQAKVGEGRSISIHCSPEDPKTWGDRVGLQHVLSNLVENALKYSDESAPVQIHCIETPEEARFEVHDRGQGISPEQLESIFDRFRQVDSSSTRKVGGFGLGLFIVKNLVDAHGGKISVESQPGQGSVFTVSLPKRASDRGALLTSTDE